MDDAGPLADLTVLEVGNFIAAPVVGLVLGDLGADVLKVEHPERGDLMRASGETGTAIFSTLNRNKRSVGLDLRDADDREAYLDLAGRADVAIENLGPGAADRLDVGYGRLRERNPGLIYCSIKGFLPGGPYSDRPGMNTVAEAMSGLMSMTGEPDGRPMRSGTSAADFAAGMYGLVATLVALRERERTGEGRRVEVGLFEAATQWTAYWSTYAQLTGEDHPALGSSHPAFPLYDVFETADGEWLFAGVVTPRQWPGLCRAIGRESLAADERFETPERRARNADALDAAVREAIGSLERDAALDALLAEGVPAAPVADPSDLSDDPHLGAVDLLADVEGVDELGRFRVPVTPIRGLAVSQRRSPPAIGEHTDEVLGADGPGDGER